MGLTVPLTHHKASTKAALFVFSNNTKINCGHPSGSFHEDCHSETISALVMGTMLLNLSRRLVVGFLTNTSLRTRSTSISDCPTCIRASTAKMREDAVAAVVDCGTDELATCSINFLSILVHGCWAQPTMNRTVAKMLVSKLIWKKGPAMYSL